MSFRKLIENLRRSIYGNRPGRVSQARRRARLTLEELETRTVPTAAAPYPPLNGLVTVISDSGPNGEQSITDFKNQLATIDDPNISGVALQIQWQEIEPNQPTNPFMPTESDLQLNRIRLVFDRAAKAENADGSLGKPVELLISAGFWSPEWVTGKYATLKKNGEIKTDEEHSSIGVVTAPFQPQYNNPKDHSLGRIPLPVPWDNPNYYKAWFGFLSEINTLYGSNPLFRSIGAAGPTSVSAEATLPNSATNDPGTAPPRDPNVVDPPNDPTFGNYTNDLEEWKAYGYNDYPYHPDINSNLVAAWKDVFQFYAKTFKTQFITLSIGGGITNSPTDAQSTLDLN